MSKRRHLIFILILILCLALAISIGSVSIPLEDLLASFQAIFTGQEMESQYQQIIYHVRLPRVLATALVGAMLSLAGALMQGLLKNPLADSSTLGISSGAALGAALAIVTGFSIPALPISGTAILASLFAFLSLLAILTLSHRLDPQLSNSTVILVGIIHSMLASALLTLVMFLFREDMQSIIFWTMGSLAATSYPAVLLLALTLLIFGGMALTQIHELNAFSLGEDTAHQLGVNVKRSRLVILIAVSFLVGVAVAVGGSIAFVGLIIPHMARRLFGPNNQVLLPASMYLGAIFLLMVDLLSRTLAPPREIPLGVLTSIIGTLVFIGIMVRRRGK